MPKDKRTQWKGDVLNFTELIGSPETVREDLYCLTFSQSQALIAAIELYRYVTRWENGMFTGNTIENFVNDTQRRLMMPCGSDNEITLTQFDGRGVYQESSDGGETWQDAPTRDPRRNVPLPPPFLPEGTEEADCTYADSIVNMAINAWINATGEGEELADVISGMLAFIGAIFGAFGAVLAPILFAIGAIIVSFGVEAWKDAFTSDVWDRFRCNLHDHMSPDGTFTGAQVDAMYDQLSVDETGIVLITLQRLVAALQSHGLTIAARSGYGSPTADCDCSEEPRVWFTNGGAGVAEEIFPNEDGEFIVLCDVFYVNGYYGTVSFYDPALGADCTHGGEIVVVSGGVGVSAKFDRLTCTSNILSSCYSLIQMYNASGAWGMTFTINNYDAC